MCIPGPRDSQVQWLWSQGSPLLILYSPSVCVCVGRALRPRSSSDTPHQVNSVGDAQLASVQASVLHLPQKRGASRAGADEQRWPICWPGSPWVGRVTRSLTGCRSRRLRAGASCCSCDRGCCQRTGRRGHCGLGGASVTSGRIYQPQESALHFSTSPTPATDHRPASHESQALWYAPLVGTPKPSSNPPPPLLLQATT